MPLDITSESYNGLAGLYANAGDWTDGVAVFRTRFSAGSGVSNKFTYNNTAGDYTLTIQTGNLGDFGFMPGDAVVITYNLYQGGGTSAQIFNTTVLYTVGNVMYIADEFTWGSGTPHTDGRQFPTDAQTSGLLIVASKTPASVEFWFNLSPNGSSLLNSMLDSEINRFEIEPVAGLVVGTPVVMDQLTNRSGGHFKVVDFTLISVDSGGWRHYRVRYKFWQWGVISDGYPEPNYYDQANCLVPCFRIKAFSQFGNPNGVLITTSQNLEANTGGFDENYNGGINLYSVSGTTWIDSLGATISQLDYSGASTFTATVEAPGQVNPTSTFRLGLVWRPVDGTYYQNIANFDAGDNLLVLAPETDFLANATPVAGPFLGEANATGARWDLSAVTITLVGSTLTIVGTITPNAAAMALFAGVPDGGRLSTLWLSLGDIAVDGMVTSTRVSLKLFNDDNYDAPTLGVQIPNVVDQVLIDHGLNVITTPLPQTTTEDDVLYRSNFRLIDNVAYEGVRARIVAVDTVTDDEFVLENIFFSFANVVNIAGRFQPNIIVQRGFNLPPLSDRNHISLTRNVALDTGGMYGITLEYGYLSRWEYWLEQANVDNDFFDITMSFNGRNKDWQRFSNSGNWIVRIDYFTRVNGVDDFNYQTVGIRPYEDDVNVSTVWGLEVLSTGIFPTNFIADELHEVTATLTWNTGAFTNAWAEMTVEDYESGNRWVISSVLSQGGIAINPLQPIAGQTLLDMTFPFVNVAVLKAYLDTELTSANKLCLSARIYSDDEPIPPTWEFLINATKDSVGAYSTARKLSPDTIYSGPLIRVRRVDGNEQDIPFILSGGAYILDTANLLLFTGALAGDWGWVVTRYDQTEGSSHASQSVMSDQAPIVMDGVVYLDPSTAKPSMLCDGVNHWERLDAPISTTQEVLALSVFNNNASLVAGYNLQLGFTGASGFPYTMMWANSGTLSKIADGLGTTGGANLHFSGVILKGAQLNIVWRNVLDEINMAINGVAGTIIVEADTFANFTRIGRRLNNFNEGARSEDVIYKRDRDQTVAWIQNNVNTFYQIF